ncbi:unnamed protein product [Phyllotreta striolata]|uniref:Cytochrome P450 n=1 Tax=Phyllotreta striolata TaxID=444603 RepID=A0A9N9TMK4_PHYSR|nr:unnamed protein product [Phyllotreta striolata]
MDTVTSICCSGVLLLLLYHNFNYLRTKVKLMYYMSKLPSDTKDHPILTNFVELQNDDVTVFKKLREWSRTLGPVYNLSSTIFFPSLNISSPEAFEAIAATTKNIEKHKVYTFLNLWLGEGLLTSTGTKWHTRRKILTPAFHFSILQQFISIFNSETKRLVASLKTECDQSWINVVPHISQFTLYSIAETSMGAVLNLENEEDKKYVSSIYKVGKILYHRFMRPWLFLNFIFYYLSPSGRLCKRLVNVLHNFTNNIIEERSNTFEKFDVPSDDHSNMYSKRRKLVLLDLLLNAKLSYGIIDDEGIKDEVNTFMFEGHDTTAKSICFTLMLLANHKNYQNEVYQEIISVLGDKNEPDINDLSELKFMERVIKESLRLYPSVPFIGRTVEEDMVVEGYFIPQDTAVNIHIFDIHRNEKHWPDPEKFDPERFLPDNCNNRHPFAFVPFSAGPRNCIGQKFALLELKAVLCGILKTFILEPVDTPQSINLVPDLTIRTADNSLKVKFVLR